MISGAAQEQSDLQLGDKVKVDLPLEMVKAVIDEDVGWDDRMAAVSTKDSEVPKIVISGCRRFFKWMACSSIKCT